MRQCEALSRTGITTEVLSQCPYDAYEDQVVNGRRYDVCYFHGKVARGEIRDIVPGKSEKSAVMVSWPVGRREATRLNAAERMDGPMTSPDPEILREEWS